MTPLIRAEIRQWRLKNGEVDGRVYFDTKDIFDDGDYISMHYTDLREGGGFRLVQVNNDLYKLYDDEKAHD